MKDKLINNYILKKNLLAICVFIFLFDQLQPKKFILG
jgi:hypothetical protein